MEVDRNDPTTKGATTIVGVEGSKVPLMSLENLKVIYLERRRREENFSL